VFYGNGSITTEHEEAAKYIEEARAMRKKYYDGHGVKCALEKQKLNRNSTGSSDTVDKVKTVMFDDSVEKAVDEMKTAAAGKEEAPIHLEYVFGPDGVVEIYQSSDFRRTKNLVQVPSLSDFVDDYQRLVEMSSSGAMRSFCFQRLQLLDSAFKMHVTINGTLENEAKSDLLGTDFYRTMKIDNHIHLAAAATAKQFVDFVRDKLENEGDTVVMEDGQTLKQVFEKAGLDSDHLTIDAFNVLADYSVYQRFDNFNSKYSPFRMAQMRKIFLKTDNHINGRYFAELTKIVLSRHEQRKGHTSACEMRLSVYGMERNEWLNVAKWVLTDWKGGIYPGNMLSSRNRWMVQIPRLWRVYCKKGGGVSFQNMLENLFIPLFEATLYPEEHPEVAELLNNIVGIDSVDDEGCLEVSKT
jgi:AMP deaminase